MGIKIDSMKPFFPLGAFFGFLSVALGAFGAHALKSKLEPRMLEIFQTGVNYQFLHAIAILVTAHVSERLPGVGVAGWCFVFGIIVFSGSLFALSLTGIRIFGAITPIGGVSLLIGWGILFWRSL